MYKIQSCLFLTILIFTYSCKNDKLWIKVKSDITSQPLTDSFIKTKFSSSAINSLTMGRGDTINKIRTFLNNYKKDNSYKIESHSDKTYVIFNPNDPISGGPTIEIKGDVSNWNIVDIRFGK